MWRNHTNHRAETKAVKSALFSAKLNPVKVCHDTGTAWGWLHVSMRPDDMPHKVVINNEVRTMTYQEKRALREHNYCVSNCKACQADRERIRRAHEIIENITGRHGEYRGEVTVELVN